MEICANNQVPLSPFILSCQAAIADNASFIQHFKSLARIDHTSQQRLTAGASFTHRD